MLNDIQLTQDGLTPSWRLTDGLGTLGASLAGYDWSTAGIYGVGGGSLKYNIIYTPPTGLTQWGIEGRDNIGGAIATGTVNLPDNSALVALLAALKTELDAVKAKTDLINTSVTVLIGDALPPVIVEIC